jgi:hypothetical protein
MNCGEDPQDFMVLNHVMAWYLSSSYYLTEHEEKKSLQFEPTNANSFMKIVGKSMQIVLLVVWSVLNPFIFYVKIQDLKYLVSYRYLHRTGYSVRQFQHKKIFVL